MAHPPLAKLAALAVVVLIATAPQAPALADPSPQLIECPDSHAHVWSLGDCPVQSPFGIGGGPVGGGGSGGLGGLLHRLTGGLL